MFLKTLPTSTRQGIYNCTGIFFDGKCYILHSHPVALKWEEADNFCYNTTSFSKGYLAGVKSKEAATVINSFILGSGKLSETETHVYIGKQ